MGRELVEGRDGVLSSTNAKAFLDRAHADLANSRSGQFFHDLREAGRLATEQFFATLNIQTSGIRQTG